MKSLLAKDTDFHYISGLEKHKTKDFCGAIEVYTKAIHINPKYT